MDFKGELKKRSLLVEEAIKKYMPVEEGPQKTVLEAMNYSLSAGGKRLRPVLLLELNDIFGGAREDAEPFVAAIEMIHTYSLIHDDLPALDNDDLRRGKPTNHKMFGEAMAILAGDGLLHNSFEVMLKESLGRSNPERLLRAAYEIAHGAGIHGMVAGQVVDVESEGKRIDLETLDFIHLNKTAAMIRGCIRCGATLGGADERELELCDRYARGIGLAFQIADDILDIVGDTEVLGKNVGSDIANEKATYPSLLGLEESYRIEAELIEEAKKSIRALNKDTEFLEALADYIISREH